MRGIVSWAAHAAKSAFAVCTALWVIGATTFLLLKETKVFIADFVTCAVISLASEAFFTGITTQLRRLRKREPIDWRLPCQPFLWSIFAYGLSAALSFRLIEMRYPSFFDWPWYLRGVAYMTCICLWEYFWGWRIEALTGFLPVEVPRVAVEDLALRQSVLFLVVVLLRVRPGVHPCPDRPDAAWHQMRREARPEAGFSCPPPPESPLFDTKIRPR